MLEVAIAKEGLQTKKGLTKEHSKEGEGNQNFKEVFSKAVIKGGSKKGEEQTQKTQSGAEVELKTLNTTDKVLHSLLNGLIASTKKESDIPLAQMTLQSKLAEAKNILESKLNRSIDIKDLKDVKTLGQLIAQANKKGLNLKNIKFELLEKSNEKNQTKKVTKEVKITNSANSANSANSQNTKITPSLVLPSILHRQGQTKELSMEVKKEEKVTLASLLSKNKTKEGVENKIEQVTLKEGEKAEKKESKNSLLSTLLNKEEKADDKKVSINAANQNSKKEQNSENSHQNQRIVEQKLGEQKVVENKTQQQIEQTKEVLRTKLATTFEEERPSTPSSKIDTAEIKPTPTVSQSSIGDRIFDAKATMRHFASSLKEQIQEYKPPISRLTLTLNPKNLGEVDVVIRSRGDTLSVQISAATAPALQILAQNSMELRQNLQNMGFENLSMHFSSSNKEGNNQGNEQQNNRKYYSEDELEDEELSAMVDQIEIQLPKYV